MPELPGVSHFSRYVDTKQVRLDYQGCMDRDETPQTGSVPRNDLRAALCVFRRTLREVIQKHITNLKAQTANSPANPMPMGSPPALSSKVQPSPLVDTPGNPVQLTKEQAQEIQSALPQLSCRVCSIALAATAY